MVFSKRYFNWVTNFVYDYRYGKSYELLLRYLGSVPFVWTNPMDKNRAEDGEDLFRRYSYEMYEIFGKNNVDSDQKIATECSLLEMLVALAIRMDEQILFDVAIGDRTGQWFWSMINSLGLGSFSDDVFESSHQKCDYIVQRFINRQYQPNGKGGLFTVENCDVDMREMEIWQQMLCWVNSTMEGEFHLM